MIASSVQPSFNLIWGSCMKSAQALLILVTLFVLTQTDAMAEQRRCPASDTNCTSSNFGGNIIDRLGEALRKTTDRNTSLTEKKEEVKNMLKDCKDCASNAFKDTYRRGT